MKVIKASVDLATWTLAVTCKNCDSQLELESADIRYDYPSYLANCCLCDKIITVDGKQVPEIVKTDILKNRYISHPCND